MKIKTIISFIVLFAGTVAQAQFTNIEIDNSGGSGYEPNEPSLAFSLQKPENLVCGTNLSASYYSRDGGYNWTKVPISSEYGVWGDPCVISDAYGNFYYFHLSNPTENGSWIDRIVCQKSTDEGQTWESISHVGLNGDKKHDNESAAVNLKTNTIYLTWTQMDAYQSTNPQDSSLIMFSYSDNMGESWSNPKRLSQNAGTCSGSYDMLRSASPCIGPEGQIYAAWTGLDAESTTSIIFDKSYDNGNSWLDKDILASDFPGGPHFDIPGIYPGVGTGWLNTACDTSGGQYNGTIYINWEDQRNGTNGSDVWLIKSEDEGENWTEPVKVNNDAVGSYQFFTRMAIDQENGSLYFIFYDRRNHNDNHTDVYLAESSDGGETFSNTIISESSFLPNEEIFFGDYNGITAHNGMIRPIWTRLHGGIISVHTAIKDETQNNGAFRQDIFTETEAYPNPIKEKSYFSYKLLEKTTVSLKVYNILGNVVCTILDSKTLPAGKYTESFNPSKYNLQTGMYYFLLSSEKGNITKKIIIE
jgi:hypothetical protein